MFTNHLLSAPELAFYANKLLGLSDDEFVSEVEDVVENASHYERHSSYDQKAQACYTEAVRRDAVHLYNRGYNKYRAGAGLTVTAQDLEGAAAKKAA
jgi:hypothetical protein